MSLGQTPTYHAGIAQSKAYRVLRQLMAQLLKKYDITMMDWSMVGLIHEAGKRGIRITDIAQALDTTKAFVTTHINVLEAKGFVVRAVDTQDTRARIVRLAPGASAKVKKIETELRQDMRERLYKHIAPKDLAVYVKVLDQIALLG